MAILHRSGRRDAHTKDTFASSVRFACVSSNLEKKVLRQLLVCAMTGESKLILHTDRASHKRGKTPRSARCRGEIQEGGEGWVNRLPQIGDMTQRQQLKRAKAIVATQFSTSQRAPLFSGSLAKVAKEPLSDWETSRLRAQFSNPEAYFVCLSVCRPPSVIILKPARSYCAICSYEIEHKR